MGRHSVPPPEGLRHDARRLYGLDPEGYDAGRPAYPERVYDVLRDRCAIGSGTRVLEIGPGTGQATHRLAAWGAKVTAVEPDPALARYLGTTMSGRAVEVGAASFEDADLGDAAFDAVVAAMSFHWVDQRVGVPKLWRILRPGGWAALWWTVFGDPARDDPFVDATRWLLSDGAGAAGRGGQPQFELDEAARTADLSCAGFDGVECELLRWTIRLDPAALRRLYASTIAVRRRPPLERERVLDGVVAVAVDLFGGVVERPFVTALYTARRM